MQKILDKNIKDLMVAHAGIGTVLERFQISCSSCAVGTCRLRDVIEVHGLSEQDEHRLFKQIAEVVYPGQEVAIPRLERKIVPETRKLSPPLAMLVAEHRQIKKAIAAISGILGSPEPTLAGKEETIRALLDFIRNYADRFHHAKEEEILFPIFNGENVIVEAMLIEHRTGRECVAAAARGLELNDAAMVAGNLHRYGELLTEHIRKEDEVLYPWMDRNLSDSQVGRLYARFAEVGREFGDQPRKYENFAESLSSFGGTQVSA